MTSTPITTVELMKRNQEANELAMHTWIGTPEQIEARKAYYIENGRFADILNNL